MSEQLSLSFANYLHVDGIDSIYFIGKGLGDTGVIEEMATAFDYELAETPDPENLGGLINKIGPAKELQDNIIAVQDILGTNDNAVSIARDWVNRSGILSPIERSFITNERLLKSTNFDLAIITGGVRNWMARRADRFVALSNKHGVKNVLLVAGNREMKSSEGPDVEGGMSEADYMKDVVAAKLNTLGVDSVIVSVNSGIGDEVMEQGAKKASEQELNWDESKIVVVSNAAAWVQNAGQMRRALRKELSEKFDKRGRQLFVVSDEFPLGTGAEPASTHQNPFSALGQIVRNAQELARHLS